MLPGQDDVANGVAVQDDGRIVVAGKAGSNVLVARLNPDGTPDTSFNLTGVNHFSPDGTGSFNAVLVDFAGRIVAAGQGPGGTVLVARFLPDGTLDPSFDTDGWETIDFGGSSDTANAVAMRPDDDDIVVAGGFFNGGDHTVGLALVQPDGTLDTSFGGGDGKVEQAIGPGDSTAYGVVVLPDSKIVVAGDAWNGTDDDFMVARFLPTGSLDTAFGTSGATLTEVSSADEDHAYALTRAPDGRLLAAGSSAEANTDFATVRYKPNGTLDTSWSGDGKQETDFGNDSVGTSVMRQADGRVVVAGYGNDLFRLARYTNDGTLDAAFGSSGKVGSAVGLSARANAVALDPDGRIVAAGRTTNVLGVDVAVTRYVAIASNPASVSLDDMRVAPGDVVYVHGDGYQPFEPVDVYLDTSDQALAVADAAGSFSATVNIPLWEQPGTHWITAIGRTSHEAAQMSFRVGVNWPQFGFSSSHNAVNPLENTLYTVNAGRLRQWFRVKIGSGPAFGSHSTPSYAAGQLIAVGGDGRAYNIEPATGHQVWSTPALVTISKDASPAFGSNGSIYVATTDGHVDALDATDGSKVDDSGSHGAAAFSSPNPFGGLVYAMLGNGNLLSLGANDLTTTVWSDFVNATSVSSVEVGDGLSIVGRNNGSVRADRASDGLGVWNFSVAGAQFKGSPTVDSGVVYIGGAGTSKSVYALDEDTGALLWSSPTASAVLSTPTVADGLVFVGTSDGLWAFDADLGGAAKWKAALGGPVNTQAAVANGVVYVATSQPAAVACPPSCPSRKLFAFDENGKKLGRWVIPADASGPIVVNGNVIVNTRGGVMIFGLGKPPKPAPAPAVARLRPDFSLRPAT